MRKMPKQKGLEANEKKSPMIPRKEKRKQHSLLRADGQILQGSP
jgi:hypothetical protein